MKKLLALAGLLILAGPLGAGARIAGSAPSFAPAKSYATGRYPYSVAVGDLNGDHKPDLATANSGGGVNTVSVLLNMGDAGFQAKVDYRTGVAPWSVAIGDLNGDGKQDLVTANITDTASVLLNRGDGSFQAKLDYRTGGGPVSVAIGDLNGDGKQDLATANAGGGGVSVLFNRGDGTFETKRDYPTGDRPFSVAIGDLNADGRPDLTTANYGGANSPNTASVLLNRGDGSFRVKRDYRTGTSPWSVAIGDLNGDGMPDLATANFDASSVSVLLNKGDGSFRAKRDYRTDGSLSVAIGDLDSDGKPDLVTVGYGVSVSVLANKGDGSFGPALDYRTGRGPKSVAIGDLNGDGLPDLATANDRGSTVSVLINTPGLCTVQGVKRQPLPAARRTLARAKCRVGTIRRAYSKRVKKGRVISQKPRFGVVLPGGGKVNLVVSRGRRHS